RDPKTGKIIPKGKGGTSKPKSSPGNRSGGGKGGSSYNTNTVDPATPKPKISSRERRRRRRSRAHDEGLEDYRESDMSDHSSDDDEVSDDDPPKSTPGGKTPTTRTTAKLSKLTAFEVVKLALNPAKSPGAAASKPAEEILTEWLRAQP